MYTYQIIHMFSAGSSRLYGMNAENLLMVSAGLLRENMQPYFNDGAL
jgi:hypothetical protein